MTKTRKTRGDDNSTPQLPQKKEKLDHPPVKEMVRVAIQQMDEENGSSLEDIKQYVLDNFNVNNKVKPHVKRGLETLLADGTVLRKSGKDFSPSSRFIIRTTSSNAARASAAIDKGSKDGGDDSTGKGYNLRKTTTTSSKAALVAVDKGSTDGDDSTS